MIESLTSEQEAKMKQHVDRWIQIGTSTGPCDREKCIEFAKEAHTIAGLPEAKHIFFAKSPIEAIEIIQKFHTDNGFYISKNEALNGMMLGYNEAWLSFYSYMCEVLNVELVDGIYPLFKLVEVCGWWSSYTHNDETYLVFQDRPEVIRMQDKVLHCEDGPSVKFSDGLCIWSIEGHRVTEQIVMSPETLTLHQIHGESNQDIRSIMINRHGWTKYLEETDAECIDSRHNDIENTIEALYNTKIFGKRFVATCPTGRVFVMGVDNDVENCEQAQKWLGNDVDRKCNVIGRT